MNGYDCVCQYGLEQFRTPTGTEIKWCPACGSLRVSGAVPRYPRLFEEAKREVESLRARIEEDNDDPSP